jgi:adenine/guanine phosphoribosyltransferase-like PRPP-binding protein
MQEPHQFWQELRPAGTWPPAPAGGFREGYPASLPDGRQLLLPIRPLPAGDGTAVASLIVNQASFAVHDALADAMAAAARPHAPDIVVGLPTLGLSLAADIARRLGHGRFVALGTSRKFWYDPTLSSPMSSITSPDQTKTLYLDPRMLPLLAGRRVLLVDDVLSTGRSIGAALSLLAKARVEPVAIGCAMLQTMRWLSAVEERSTALAGRVDGALRTPLLRRSGEGWVPAPAASGEC